jgi:flagellar protein FlbD
MITLTRISGSVFALNADLIERIDATPDTVITLVDGKKYVVAESLAEVTDLIRRHRSEVIALSSSILADPLPTQPALAPVAPLREEH